MRCEGVIDGDNGEYKEYKKKLREAYNSFAKDFSSTRSNVWREVVVFLEGLREDLKSNDKVNLNVGKAQKNPEQNHKEWVIDLGAGNGRHSYVSKHLGFKTICFDFSASMINICKRNSRAHYYVIGDIQYLPFKDAVFYGLMAIASLHHLLREEDLNEAISEMKRVMKHKGLISVWKYEQERFTGKSKIYDVKWRGKYTRMYRLFERGEGIEKLFNTGFKNVEEKEDKQNYWYVVMN